MSTSPGILPCLGRRDVQPVEAIASERREILGYSQCHTKTTFASPVSRRPIVCFTTVTPTFVPSVTLVSQRTACQSSLMLDEGFWAEIKVGGEQLRLFSERNALGVQTSVYNVATKSWIAPSRTRR
jgi:hypothetical protein